MKTLAPLFVVLFLTAALVLPALAEGKAQTNCPVMGGKVDKAVFVDHEGSRIYFCCKDCIAKFEADPAKFLAKFKADGIEPEKAPVAQTVCPLDGEKIDRSAFIDRDGFRIYFCCKHCPETFLKNPAKYFAQLKSAGVELEKAPVEVKTPAK